MLAAESYQAIKILCNNSGKQRVEKHFVVICPICGKERNVNYRNFKNLKSERCLPCSSRKTMEKLHAAGDKRIKPPNGSKNHLYKRGYPISKENGYVFVSLHKGHKYREMADSSGRCRLHRIVMAEYLGRLLYPEEVVHHKNGDRSDNRIENLELVSDSVTHISYTRMQQEIERLRFEIQRLKGEVSALQDKKVGNWV